MKRVMLIVLSVLFMFAGLFNISCKNGSKGAKANKKLDDSTFVELAARQNLLIQKYHVRAQQIKSDSEKTVLSDEFTKETDEILNKHGVSREQLNNYLNEIKSDSLKARELQKKIVFKIKELIAEEKENKSQ